MRLVIGYGSVCILLRKMHILVWLMGAGHIVRMMIQHWMLDNFGYVRRLVLCLQQMLGLTAERTLV